MRYWIDADTLINANQGPFPIANARHFWKALGERILQGQIVAPKMVYDEIMKRRKKDDELGIWIKNRKESGLYIKPSPAVDEYATKIGDYVFGGRWPVRQAMKFSNGADGWLIAQALHDKGIVVSNESDRHPKSERVRIPDVCHEFKIRCITLNKMIVEIGLQY